MCYNLLMEKLKTKIRRFLYVLKNDWLRLDNVILAAAIVFCLAWTYGAIMSMSRNWELAQILAEKKYELKIAELEVENLELENKYYSSDEYKELSARAKMNKKLPGENLVYLPKNSDYAKNKHKEVAEKKMVEKSNLAQWLAFLLGV